VEKLLPASLLAKQNSCHPSIHLANQAVWQRHENGCDESVPALHSMRHIPSHIQFFIQEVHKFGLDLCQLSKLFGG
jgi:hypothetical protein